MAFHCLVITVDALIRRIPIDLQACTGIPTDTESPPWRAPLRPAVEKAVRELLPKKRNPATKVESTMKRRQLNLVDVNVIHPHLVPFNPSQCDDLEDDGPPCEDDGRRILLLAPHLVPFNPDQSEDEPEPKRTCPGQEVPPTTSEPTAAED